MKDYAPERARARPFVQLVTDEELDNPELLRDVKAFARKLQVPRRRFIDWLADGVRDAETMLIDSTGSAVEIDLEALERDHIDLWFRDWIKRPADHIAPRVRAESRERVRAMVTILRMMFPKESSVWGCDVSL